MSNELAAMSVILLFIVGTAIVGMIPGMKEKLTLEGWAVGGRRFGHWLSWFVLAGEIYTAFAFLGASGWAYGKGAPAFYILAYGSVAYVVGYYVLPAISPIGKKHGLLTQPDLVEHLYGSKALGILVAIIGVLFLLPYLQLQITGLGIILETTSYGLIPRIPAILIAFTLVVIFLYLSGLKGVASTAVIKDIVMIIAVVFFGLYLPIHFFGSVGGMFEALNAAKPGFLTLPGGTKNLDVSWAMSTIALTALGFYMWPHLTANSYSAKSPDVLRHNAVFLPLYQISLIFPLLIGFTALLVLKPLKNPDMAFMTIVREVFPGWAVGLVGGAGALACMIPGADLSLTTSMLFTRNVYVRWFNPNASQEYQHKVVRMMVIVIVSIAALLAIFAPNLLVNLLLMGYSGVTQFFPLIVGGVFWKKATKAGAFSGLIVGEILVAYLLLNKIDPVPILGLHLNAGFVALVVNAVVYVVVSLLTYSPTVMKEKET
ncbi:sodium:solute symporter family protein [Caldanaerobacter subterraneus KAk]|uniref:sodium:solute symporter family protein n=1 Tax=Caldanaerobacter subterraneus TaxID=911092 RepID=UPI0032C0E8C8